MPTWKCNTCHGTYSDTTRGRGTYHHACPLTRADESGEIVELVNRRDENMGTARGDRIAGILSEGAGVTPISHADMIEPAWLSRLKYLIAKQEEEDESAS